MSINKIIKERAIKLRKEGKTYSDILKEIHVAKSTLSLWLGDVGLSKKQKRVLTERMYRAALRGGAAKRNQRLLQTQIIRHQALKDIQHISMRELWLIGVMLYWAEGSKEKYYQPGSGINFNNSDSRMIKLFITWLLKSCKVTQDRIKCEVYIHRNSKNNVNEVRKYWAKVTNLPLKKFDKVYFKKNKIKTNRKNIGDLYYGLLRVKVSASSSLLRQVAGWTEAIIQNVK